MSEGYKLRWDLKFDCGEFSKEELGESGGTDALVIGSLLYPEDGSFSATWFSCDGRDEGKPLDDQEIFKFWAMMAYSLSESKTLGEGHRALLRQVHETIRDAVLLGRNGKEPRDDVAP